MWFPCRLSDLMSSQYKRDIRCDMPSLLLIIMAFPTNPDGKFQEKWQFKKDTVPFHDIGGTGKTVSHYHLSPEGWLDLPGGEQQLCYNEIATKHNWHYLRVDFDLATMKYLAFQCNDSADHSRWDPLV